MSHITPEKVRAGVVRLSKLPGNNKCADCKVDNPKWASVNIGIFLCVQCAGIHRELGVHITQVHEPRPQAFSLALCLDDLMCNFGQYFVNRYDRYHWIHGRYNGTEPLSIEATSRQLRFGNQVSRSHCKVSNRKARQCRINLYVLN